MNPEVQTRQAQVGGLAGWLLTKLRNTQQNKPRLALLERIHLAPKQTLALVEAEGRRFLVATGADGSPAFYALDEAAGQNKRAARPVRVSW